MEIKGPFNVSEGKQPQKPAKDVCSGAGVFSGWHCGKGKRYHRTGVKSQLCFLHVGDSGAPPTRASVLLIRKMGLPGKLLLVRNK